MKLKTIFPVAILESFRLVNTEFVLRLFLTLEIGELRFQVGEFDLKRRDLVFRNCYLLFLGGIIWRIGVFFNKSLYRIK